MTALSIVATLYRSAPYVAEFVARASAAAHQFVGDDFEIVLVNDGSPDTSLELAVGLTATVPQLRVVDLSRNFGHHKAMMTGLQQSRGAFVYLLDSDLEEQPEWLSIFHAQLQQDQADVVYGVQRARKGGTFERISGKLFYRVHRMLSGVTIPENVVTARLMTRRYVDALVQHDEREVFMAGLWLITGFKQVPHVVDKLSTSETTYNLRRKMAVLVNSITSFSNAPLIGIFYIGLTISLLAGIYTLYLVFNWLLANRAPGGWTSLIASVWLLGGLIISFIGVVGIYLAKIFSETKRRPYTIIRAVHGASRD